MTRHVDRADGGLRFANPPYDRAFMEASPPMAAGHPGAHLGSVRREQRRMVGAIIQARRYLCRQVSNSRHRLKRLTMKQEIGPCLRRGLRGEKMISILQHRIPGGCRGLLPKRCGACRAGPRRPALALGPAAGRMQCIRYIPPQRQGERRGGCGHPDAPNTHFWTFKDRFNTAIEWGCVIFRFY
jgi:hypothetical protein